VTERRQVAREVEPELVERYVENGALRIEWRDFAYLRQEPVKDAQGIRVPPTAEPYRTISSPIWCASSILT
jgi:hypothetical protein